MRRSSKLIIVLLFIITSFVAGTLIGYLGTHRVGYYISNQTNVHNLIRLIAENVSSIRGLKFSTPPEAVLIDSSTALSTWGDEVPKDALILNDVFKMTLLSDLSYDVTESFRKLIGLWLAASSGNTIYVVHDLLNVNDPLTYRVLAHELTHVLQNQHFKLPTPRTLDEALAIKSLVEGDADLTADIYVGLLNLSNLSKVTKIQPEDPYIAIQLAPYVFGEEFVRYLYDIGGWGLVNNAYVVVPKSMKYIMFPEKYIINEPIETIDLPRPMECDILYEGALGPAYIYVLISRYLNESLALKLSSDWLGDKVIYYVCNESKELMWIIKLASNEGAANLYNLLNEIAVTMGGRRYDDYLHIDGPGNLLKVSIQVERNLIKLHSKLLSNPK